MCLFGHRDPANDRCFLNVRLKEPLAICLIVSQRVHLELASKAQSLSYRFSNIVAYVGACHSSFALRGAATPVIGSFVSCYVGYVLQMAWPELARMNEAVVSSEEILQLILH